ncbi:MAG: GatB/YqeY domain-containing protein [Rhodospirillales bacterium]|nr:GatB/YqeY domain-containing protein [Rhodospirillales bacterium]
MTLRTELTEALKSAMRAGDAPRVSAIRLIHAKLKDADIAARPKGVAAIPDEEIQAMLRGMVKSRRESVTLYEQGRRPELAAKEMAEIAVIESFLPQAMDQAAVEAAVAAAIAETGASSVKDMGKVMGLLKARHGAALDMALANPVVRAKLAG